MWQLGHLLENKTVEKGKVVIAINGKLRVNS